MDEKEINILAKRVFSLIELVQLAIPEETKFKIIRKKLLDLANDIQRLSGESNGS